MTTEYPVFLDKVVDFYNGKGQNITIKTVENCLSTTADAYNISSKEVYTVISPYFHESTTEASSTVLNVTNVTNVINVINVI